MYLEQRQERGLKVLDAIGVDRLLVQGVVPSEHAVVSLHGLQRGLGTGVAQEQSVQVRPRHDLVQLGLFVGQAVSTTAIWLRLHGQSQSGRAWS